MPGSRPVGFAIISGRADLEWVKTCAMREILPGIFTWGSAYADRPWDLNGYAITFDGYAVLVDPPVPEHNDWSGFDKMKAIPKIVLTNRDHVRDAELFRT